MCQAQIEKIDTDRPDQTESAATVPKKWVQFEFGLNAQTATSLENEFQHLTLLRSCLKTLFINYFVVFSPRIARIFTNDALLIIRAH